MFIIINILELIVGTWKRDHQQLLSSKYSLQTT
jgi:hypothetical protein